MTAPACRGRWSRPGTSTTLRPEEQHLDLEELIAEYIERREAGEAITPESFAGEYPGGGPELVRRLAALASAEALFPDDTALERVGPYRVLEEIGRGGMGVVYRAHDEETDSVVALKVLNLVAQTSSRMAERFTREGAVLQTLSHPNIVRIERIGTDADLPWIAMELVEGRPLSRILRDGVIRRETGQTGEILGDDWRAAAKLAVRLAVAVAAAHEAGVHHRDLKPGNVIVRPDGEPVLLDFGLVGHEDSPTLTRTGELVGTPQYMAPEQARGEKTDSRSDVYGLGVLLFELLTSRPPHHGDDAMQVLESVWSIPAPPILDVRADLPESLAVVVDRALAFAPADRYSSADSLAEDLQAVLAGGSPRRGRGLLRRFFRR